MIPDAINAFQKYKAAKDMECSAEALVCNYRRKKQMAYIEFVKKYDAVMKCQHLNQQEKDKVSKLKNDYYSKK